METAAAQLNQNEASDWFLWTQPEADGGLARGEFVGDAVRGFSLAVEDNGLVSEMNLDAYRFNPSWARIRPTRDRSIWKLSRIMEV